MQNVQKREKRAIFGDQKHSRWCEKKELSLKEQTSTSAQISSEFSVAFDLSD